MYIWENPSSTNPNSFTNVVKQRLIDESFHNLESKRTVDTLYRHVKPVFGYERFLNLILSRCNRGK